MDKKTATKLEKLDFVNLEKLQVQIGSWSKDIMIANREIPIAQQEIQKILSEYGIILDQIRPDGTIVRSKVGPPQPQDHKKKKDVVTKEAKQKTQEKKGM